MARFQWSTSCFAFMLFFGCDGLAPVFNMDSSVLGIPNQDDDDSDGTLDWESERANDDDAYPIDLIIENGDRNKNGYVRLELSGDEEDIRIWGNGEILADGSDEDALLGMDEIPEQLYVEFADFLVTGNLSLQLLNPQGEIIDAVDISLASAPMIISHHLYETDHVWVMRVYDNADMIQDFTDALGDVFTPIQGTAYYQDIWVQDEFEFATVTAPGLFNDIVIDSIRDRELDDFPEEALQGPDTSIRTWGSKNTETTYDSFGNLEVSPPITVNDVHYPFGRIYYGAEGFERPTQQLTNVLAAQGLQDPVEIDTSWLCVGHVDEFVSFIPDENAEKGFRFLFSDTRVGYELLETMDPETVLTRYMGAWDGHGIQSVEEMIEDDALRAYNEDIQTNYLDPILAKMKAEFSLTDDDIYLVPSLFEDACGDLAAALIPGMVNLVVANVPDEPIKILMADPYMRTDVNDQSSDPFIAAMSDLFPEAMELHFVDNWTTYHMALGEVHCGTNVRRIPTGEWWTDAAHLVEREIYPSP